MNGTLTVPESVRDELKKIAEREKIKPVQMVRKLVDIYEKNQEFRKTVEECIEEKKKVKLYIPGTKKVNYVIGNDYVKKLHEVKAEKHVSIFAFLLCASEVYEKMK